MRHSRIALVLARLTIGENDSLLLLRHAKWGDWGLPGGHVEAGESPAEAALRELHEELPLQQTKTGVQIVPLRDRPLNWGPVPSRSARGAQTRYTTWYFAARFAADPLRALSRLGSGAIVFIPLRNLDVAAWPPGVTDQLHRFANEHPEGLNSLPVSWPHRISADVGLPVWSDSNVVLDQLQVPS